MSTPTGLELDPLEEHLLAALRALEPSTALRAAPPEVGEIWRAQVDSRQADYAARWLQQHGRSFYTIGSAGHEGNAGVAAAVRATDPALLHYRSGAFYLTRSAAAGRLPEEGLRDVLLGDVTWETSYGLPGEGQPPRVVAHVTFDWPSWSQTAYRRWYVDEELDTPPAIEMEIVLRVQRLAEAKPWISVTVN